MPTELPERVKLWTARQTLRIARMAAGLEWKKASRVFVTMQGPLRTARARTAEEKQNSGREEQPMKAYEVRLAGAPVRYASALSRHGAAELILAGAASAHPPAGSLQRPPDCFVREHGGRIAETPFWRAKEAAEPDAIPVEGLNASNDE